MEGKIFTLKLVKDSEVFDRLIEGLIKAGYKENPSNYYKVKKENKLTGQEIQELIFGKTIVGKIFNTTWSVTIKTDGESEYTSSYFGIHKGKSWIEGDTVCSQYESLYDGLKACSDVYKNPEGDNMTYSEYLWLSDYLLAPFSIQE